MMLQDLRDVKREGDRYWTDVRLPAVASCRRERAGSKEATAYCSRAMETFASWLASGRAYTLRILGWLRETGPLDVAEQ